MYLSDEIKQLVKFHHIGIAVRSFEKSLNYYNALGYECSIPVIDPHQEVELILCKSDVFPWVELIKPISDDSPVMNYLKNAKEAMYHQCYTTTDINRTLDLLKTKNRVICVSKPYPAVLFYGEKVSFYYISGVGLMEFIEGNE